MPSAPRQLALALEHAESFAREDFLSGASNAAALALVDSWPAWPDRTVMLTGPAGSGKSHLAAVWARAAGARLVAAHALDEAGVPRALATGALVVEELAPGAFDERALFHLLNLAREEQAFVLLTARSAALDCAIRDLGSRLRALPLVVIAPPDEALLRAVLVAFQRPASRGRRKPDRLRGHADRTSVRRRSCGGGAARRRGHASETSVNQGIGRGNPARSGGLTPRSRAPYVIKSSSMMAMLPPSEQSRHG